MCGTCNRQALNKLNVTKTTELIELAGSGGLVDIKFLLPKYCPRCITDADDLRRFRDGECEVSTHRVVMNRRFYKRVLMGREKARLPQARDAQSSVVTSIDSITPSDFHPGHIFLTEHLEDLWRLMETPLLVSTWRRIHPFGNMGGHYRVPGTRRFRLHHDSHTCTNTWCSYPRDIRTPTLVTPDVIAANIIAAAIHPTLPTPQDDSLVRANTVQPFSGVGQRLPQVVEERNAVAVDALMDRVAEAESLSVEMPGMALVARGGEVRQAETLTGFHVNDLSDLDTNFVTYQPPSWVRGPPGIDVQMTPHRGVHRSGPQLVPANVWHNHSDANVLVGLQGRTRTQAVYDTSSAAAKASIKLYDALITQFTEDRMSEVLARMPPVAELVRYHMPEADTDKITDFWRQELMTEPLRNLTVKLEVIAKQAKFPRLIYDETNYLYLLNAQIHFIMKEIIFHQIFPRWSIKGRDKIKVADDMRYNFGGKVKRRVNGNNSQKEELKLVGIEVDQTSMERHTTSNGVRGNLYQALRILRHVANYLINTIDDPFIKQYLGLLELDEEKLRVRYRGRNENNEGRPVRFEAQFQEFFMTSGWLFTSLVNFINETVATVSALSPEPEHLLALDFKKSTQVRPVTLMELGTHLGMFKSWWDTKIFIELVIEGDDVAGRVSAECLDNQPQIEANFTSLGYKTKLKFIKTGRLEFCGLHFYLKDGLARLNWIPDVMRTLCKVGTATTSCDDYTAAIITRFYSLAVMFAGKCTPMCEMLLRYARTHFDDYHGPGDVEVNRFETPLFAMVADTEGTKAKISLGKAARAAELYCESKRPKALSVKAQCALMSLSICDQENKISTEEFENWLDYAVRADYKDHAEDVIPLLPKVVQNLIAKSYDVPLDLPAQAAANDVDSEAEESFEPPPSQSASRCASEFPFTNDGEFNDER
jgi:hypothetical protein